VRRVEAPEADNLSQRSGNEAFHWRDLQTARTLLRHGSEIAVRTRVFVVVLALLVPTVASAQQRRARQAPGEAIDFSVEGADLPELVRSVARITGRRFILATSVRTIQATVVSEEPVSAQDVYRAFLSILLLNGLTIVRSGRYELIVESPGIERRPLPVVVDGSMRR
jgi:type II secretory pathway component GspD/PulD (secretin)